MTHHEITTCTTVALFARGSWHQTLLGAYRPGPAGPIYDFDLIRPTPWELLTLASPPVITETDVEAARYNAMHPPPPGSPRPVQRLAVSRDEHTDIKARCGAANWYLWRQLHWGVRYSGIHAQLLETGPQVLVVSFWTETAAPEELIDHLLDEGVGVVGGAVHADTGQFQPLGSGDPALPSFSDMFALSSAGPGRSVPQIRYLSRAPIPAATVAAAASA